MSENSFCVYEHWRPDLGVCFYVGKGKAKRARTLEARNDRYGRTVKKIIALGYAVDIRIFDASLTEEDAFRIERERIAFWRTQHSHLTNQTDGGDGTSGRLHSDVTKQKIRNKAIGRKLSAETKAKMSASRFGQTRSPESKERMRKAAIAVQGESRKRYCSTPAGKRQMHTMAKKAANDPAVREARSRNAKALWATPEYQEKMAARRHRGNRSPS